MAGERDNNDPIPFPESEETAKKNSPINSFRQTVSDRYGDVISYAVDYVALLALTLGINAGINRFKPGALDFLNSPKTPVVGYLVAMRDRDRDMSELQGILQDELKPDLSQKTTALIDRLERVDLNTYQKNVEVSDVISDAGVRMVTWKVNDPNLPHPDPKRAHDITVQEFSVGNHNTFEQISFFADKDDNLTNDEGPAEARIANQDLVSVGERSFQPINSHFQSKKFDLSTVGSLKRSDVLAFFGPYWKMYDGVVYPAQERAQLDWRDDQVNGEVGASRDGRRWMFFHARSQEELDQEKRESQQALADIDAKLKAEKEAQINIAESILREDMKPKPLLKLIKLISSLQEKEQGTGDLYLFTSSYKLADGTVEDVLNVRMPADEYSPNRDPDIKVLRFTRPDGSVRDNLTFYIGLDGDFDLLQTENAEVLSPDEYQGIENYLFNYIPGNPNINIALNPNGLPTRYPVLIDQAKVDFEQVRGDLTIDVEQNGEVIFNFDKEPV